MKFIDWLQLMLIYLKLTGQIDWLWIVVLIPLELILMVGFAKAIIKVAEKEDEQNDDTV